jgi:hypothetical protein
MPWQQYVADIAGEVDPGTDLLAYPEVVLTAPRQSGKSELGVAVKTHRCLGFGGPQTVLYTARDRIHALARWEPRPARPAGLAVVPAVHGASATRAGGDSLGERLPLGHHRAERDPRGISDARSRFVDEAWARVDNKLETGLSPTMITRPQPQLGVVSTAGTVASTWLRGKVDAGREQPDGRGTAYFEWSAPADADPGHLVGLHPVPGQYGHRGRDPRRV